MYRILLLSFLVIYQLVFFDIVAYSDTLEHSMLARPVIHWQDDLPIVHLSSLKSNIYLVLSSSREGMTHDVLFLTDSAGLALIKEAETDHNKTITNVKSLNELQGMVHIENETQALEFVRLRTDVSTYAAFDDPYQEVSCVGNLDYSDGLLVSRRPAICRKYIPAVSVKVIQIKGQRIYTIRGAALSLRDGARIGEIN